MPSVITLCLSSLLQFHGGFCISVSALNPISFFHCFIYMPTCVHTQANREQVHFFKKPKILSNFSFWNSHMHMVSLKLKWRWILSTIGLTFLNQCNNKNTFIHYDTWQNKETGSKETHEIVSFMKWVTIFA